LPQSPADAGRLPVTEANGMPEHAREHARFGHRIEVDR
jgi:hypothetical protein